jgi:hypothetical protein
MDLDLQTIIKNAIESKEEQIVLDFNGAINSSSTKTLPSEILQLGSRLIKLNAASQHFSSLPLDYTREQLSTFSNLRTLFFLGNDFEEIPIELGVLSSLFMLSFKSNKLVNVPEGSLSSSIGWLILTDNRIPRLPRSIGTLSHLRKLMLSGNHLETLPEELSLCSNLELVRLSDNKLTSLPASFLSLPRLAWLALASNPLTEKAMTLTTEKKRSLSCIMIKKSDLELGPCLGEGASGFVHTASIVQNDVTKSITNRKIAVKVYKPTSSDGKTEDEVKVARCLPIHSNLIESLGYYDELSKDDDLRENIRSLGLVMEFVDGKLLGSTPSFTSITRDTFPEDITFSLAECLKIAKSIASALSHMHKFGIAHGDIYAHNIIHKGISGVKLGDFGAAYFMPSDLKDRLTRIDWRGFGFLLDDLLSRCKEGCGGGSGGKDVARLELEMIRNECLQGKGEDAVKILKGVFEKS